MSNVNSITDFLEAGLKAEDLRQKAIASNIANLETEGYRRFDVDFKDMLAKAMKSGKKIDFEKLETNTYQPLNTTVKGNGNDVSLDYEVGQMVKNSLRHRTYTMLLGKVYGQMNLAINVK